MSKIVTTCRTCTFAEYENGRQVGCAFHNRLHYFAANDIPINDIEEEGVHTKQVETFCNSYRPQHLYEFSEQLIGEVWEQIRIQVDLVVILEDDTDLDYILKKYDLAYIKHIHLLQVKDNQINSREVLIKYKDYRAPISITRSYQDNLGSSIDEVVKRCKHQYVLIGSASNLLELWGELPEINLKLNLYMKHIMMVGNSLDKLLISGKIYKLVKGNIPSDFTSDETNTIFNNVIEKVQFLAKDQNKESMLLSWEELDQ